MRAPGVVLPCSIKHVPSTHMEGARDMIQVTERARETFKNQLEDLIERPGATAPAPGWTYAVEGRIENIDPSRTAITLRNGTKLVTPVGAVLKPGVVTEGMLVVASYREENGAKVLTGLTVKDRGPATR